ncbi:MAG: hypothetical protein ACLFRY_12850, partial [Spirochaetia bacterium]
MGGLYKKAKSFLPKEKLLSAEELGISEEDGREILGQIENAVSKDRIDISEKDLTYTARKNSGTLPLVVNFAALVIVAAGIFLFF